MSWINSSRLGPRTIFVRFLRLVKKSGRNAAYITDRSDNAIWALPNNAVLGAIGADDIITGGDNARNGVCMPRSRLGCHIST